MNSNRSATEPIANNSPYGTSTDWVLRDNSDHAVFDLLDGARMTRLVLGGHPLLVEHDGQDDMWWGAFIMAPWTSVSRGGIFEFDGTVYRIAAPDSDQAWHGTVRNHVWLPAENGAVSTSIGGPWPLGGSVTLTADLTASTLTLHLRLRAANLSMPAAIGWHPWFRRSLETGEEVHVAVPNDALVQERDADDRPTGNWVKPARRWNDCLSCDGPIDLKYAGAGTLRVTYSSSFVTLFTTDKQGVCIEPVTSAAERMDNRLDPGDELSLDIRLAWLPCRT